MRRLALALALAALAAAGGARASERIARVVLVDALPPSPSVSSRLDQIRDRIERALVYPPNARARALEGTAQLEFEIDAQGRARDVETTRSSGHWVLDRAARRALRAAAPLPYVWGRLAVPVRFSLDEPAR